MRPAEIVDSLKTIDSTELAPPLVLPPKAAPIYDEILHRLPPQHRELVLLSNGVQAYHGFYRLFGLGPVAACDMVAWNHEAAWKFAWDERVQEYWSFGESPWGDQYVYQMAELSGKEATPVLVLDAFSMTEKGQPFRWGSFGEFLEKEFLRCAREPWDDMARAAYERLGALNPNQLLNYVPSLMITGEESLEYVTVMNATSTMIANGDMYGQLADLPEDRQLARIDVVKDEAGRDRLRVVWAE